MAKDKEVTRKGGADYTRWPTNGAWEAREVLPLEMGNYLRVGGKGWFQLEVMAEYYTNAVSHREVVRRGGGEEMRSILFWA